MNANYSGLAAGAATLSILSASILSACGGDNSPPGSNAPTTEVPASVQPTEGANYTLSVFAEAPGALQPDDLLQMGATVFVIYQDNNDNPDGTIVAGVKSAQSQVLEYDMNGNVLQTFKVPGHPDGLAAYNATTVWVSSNEDANPVITIIDTTTNAMKTLTSDVPVLPHGGGLDDMKVIDGVVYASGSNPTVTLTPIPNLSPYSTDSSGATAAYGVSTSPAVYSITLNADGKTFHSTPVLYSSSTSILLPGGTAVTLNMTDPDSSAIDPAGDLVTVSQQDSEIVFLQNLTPTSASTSVLPLTLSGNPWPIDDIRWPSATGSSHMLVSDNQAGLVYRIDAANGFAGGTPYAAGQGTVLEVNATTGVMTPIYIGMGAPHGLIFIPD